MTVNTNKGWLDICAAEDLVANSGVAALVNDTQIAIFHLPEQTPNVFAIGNYDPIGQAQVLSRGMVGDVNGEPAVASPLYKQHYRLHDGSCIEDQDAQAGSWPCKIEAGRVLLQVV